MVQPLSAALEAGQIAQPGSKLLENVLKDFLLNPQMAAIPVLTFFEASEWKVTISHNRLHWKLN